jgi:peroxiredoxin
MSDPVSPTAGWGVLHLFCKPTPLVDAEAVQAAVKTTTESDHQVVTVSMLGHKADLAFMAIGPDLRQLRRLQSGLQAAGLDVVDSYVSLTELSEYSKGLPPEMLEARLHPRLPPEGKNAFCFYPMSKRREFQHNWFTLPYDDRSNLMREHGRTGRTFAGRVLQVVTGSAGLDDYEWGVTLFAVHPDDLKDVVYTMRFDRASAVYAEFGPFYTGMVTPLDELLASS